MKFDHGDVCYPRSSMTRASFVGAKNRFYLMIYDVINYNYVISAADSYESVKDVCFTDV